MATVNFVGAGNTAGPFAIDGHYPLYATEAKSNTHDGGNGTSHLHVFFGQNFYMPNGLVLGTTYYHGTYDGSLTAEYNQSATTTSASSIKGYYYYKLDKDAPEYHNAWKTVDNPTQQRIITTYDYTQVNVDLVTDEFWIGCYPNTMTSTVSGYDIIIKVNAVAVTDFTYGEVNREGFIRFASTRTFKAGDFIEISAYSDKGLVSTTGISKYEIPLSWGHNTKNTDITYISAPEYTGQFKDHIEGQEGFTGKSLGSNNYQDGPKVAGIENNIVQTNQDILLGAFLLDDQPGNLVDALRFNANEYVKFKNRVRHEIEKYYSDKSVTGLSNEYILEQVLRNVTSFKIGKDVFSKTYILPFGDNYTKQDFIITLGTTAYTLTKYLDLDLIENSLLVYLNNKLLTVEKDYTISSYNPIEITLVTTVTAGDTLCTKLYNAERDSAQCPPTPSTMGILPLHQPIIATDTSFKTSISTLIGHDGSRQKAFGDFRDDILLEFETRIYNSAKAEFRTANSLPAYNSIDIRCGAFRTNGYTHNEFHDLLRHYFSAWNISNKLDPVVNEFYDSTDEWTWNYSSTDLPGHWRGFYEYYYDTVRPNTHPWEMLGFTEKPLWFDAQYYVYADTDVSKSTPSINYGSTNIVLWADLEQGIIRQGPRKNTTSYTVNNPYRRIGLSKVLPIDSSAKLISPYRIKTTDSSSITVDWANTTGTADSLFAFRTGSFRALDGISVSTDNNKLYVESNNLPTTTSKTTEQKTTFAFPRLTQLNDSSSWNASSQTKAGAVGVLVNGDPLMSLDSGKWWDNNKTYDTATWIYNKGQESGLGNSTITTAGVKTHYTITPEVIGLTAWATDSASPIVGWAFDGLPIYGPYGYSDASDNTSSIVRIKSGWELDTRARGTGNADETTGPGGKPTGQYIKDFKISASAGSSGYTTSYNMRLAVTPDSATPIYHYVATINADGTPAFPYHVGGGIISTDRWKGEYRSVSEQVGAVTSINVTDKGGLYTSAPSVVITGDGNNAAATAVITNKKLTSVTVTTPGSGYTYATATITGGGGVRAKVTVSVSGKDNSTFSGKTNSSATAALTSTKSTTLAKGTGLDGVWKFGDGAPVENAFKYSSTYPFALAEALLLAKPGRFATVFSDPTTLSRPAVNNTQFLSKNTNKRWKFLNTTDFKIHGDVNKTTGKMHTNIGYTQFINSWLKFQGLDTTLNFATPLRSLNVKLAHRMSGFIDKDTLSARTDQYSNSGNATSLIIPKENITTTLHSSNYKSRNFYSGVVVEQTSTGYRVRGFDKNRGYFEVIEGIKTGKSLRIEVGGDPETFSVWKQGVTYSTGNIVQYRNNFYQAPLSITSGTIFDTKLWQRLAKLPQIDSATAVQYLDSTEVIKRIPYETEYTTVQEVVDLMINLGRFQASQGFDFSQFDSDIAAVKDWAYSAKQFLFWTTGVWQIGNTIELSPLAGNVKFIAPRGFIAKINRTDREQFAILDQIGEGIDPTHCTILRENDYIEVSPPTGSQIYSLMLFTKEIEHALVFDNETNFSDVIFNDTFNQRHKRIKLKGQRTANWEGKFLSQGFIIDGEELLPNLDNMAESLGRYHEFGFIPVEKQVYQASRSLFGYTERDYLTELDIQDDEQFDFYRGMIQGKGTKESLGRIARSSAVVSGNVSIFDEWALRVGDFGDTENDQSIELKLVKTEITQDPQLITLDFPENVTNIVERVDVVDATYAYNIVPSIEISGPGIGGVQATATATLDTATSKLQKITVTNSGSGYGAIPTAKVLASNIVLSSGSSTINKTIAPISNYFDFTQTTASITIADALSSNTAQVITVTNGGSAITTANVLTAINDNLAINANVKVSLVPSEVISGSSTVTKYTAIFAGKDFYLDNADNFGTDNSNANVHYQPIQRYAVSSAMAGSTTQTTINDVAVTIDGTAVASSYFTYDSGSISSVTTTATYPSLDTTATRADGVIVYPEQNNSFTITLSTAIDTNNLEVGEDGNYKFVDLYIGNVLISNNHNSLAFGDHDNNSSTADQQYTTVNGTMFTIAANGASVTFPDVKRLPESVKSTIMNPPTTADADGKQQQIVKVIASGTVIKVIEDPTVTLATSLKTDIPGAVLNIKVTAQDGIAVRMGTKRNYAVTADDKNDDTILIDIDDSTRFIKKPTGVKENNLWPTTKLVNASGLTDPKYATIKNAGYVNKGNVTFQSFDIASLPELYSSDLIFKPTTNDLVHIAYSEDNDWNVYKLTPTDASVHYLKRNAGGKVSLLTNDSLFNYLDTNEIGTTDSGKYLDYYLSLDNANINNQVVVWTNENVVQEKQSQITDFSAPQMIQARIESIGPQVSKTITAVNPHLGKIINGVTLTPINKSDKVVATGDITSISNLDAFQLVDNVGIETQNPATLTAGGTNQVVVDPIRVESITVSSGGSGYASAPTVTLTASPTSDTASALATIIGPISTAVTIGNGGLGYAAPILIISDPENTDPDSSSPTFGLANVATATATINSDGTITAVTVTNAGAGYTTAPTITVQGDATVTALLTSTLNALVDSIVMYNRGSGYSATSVAVTVSGNATATATKTTPATSPIAKLYAAASNNATKVGIRFLSDMKDSLAFKITTPRTVSEQATYDAIKVIQNRRFKLISYNTTTGTFILQHPAFGVANVITNLKNIGYEAKVVTTFTPNGATHFTVTDTGYRRFEFEDITSGSTIGYSQNVTIRHLNKSKLTIANHCLTVGDTIRVFTNTFSGAYNIDTVIDTDNVIIKAPYIPGFSSGSIYGDGIQIKTVAPHGISPIYASSNKSIAVHFADPKAYNKTYIIDSLTPNTINIGGRWAPITGTATYYEHKIATLTGATAYDGTNSATATNVVDVTNDPKLNEIIVTYSANSNIVPPQFVRSEGAKIKIHTDALPAVTPANTYPPVGISVARQRGRDSDRYPLVTTLGFDEVNVNGSTFKIDNINSAKAVESSINRAIGLRREHVRQKDRGSEVGFVIMNNPDTTVFNGLSSKYISNYGAYINDPSLVNEISGGALVSEKSISYASAGENVIDNEFNPGPLNSGPIHGLAYTDPDTLIYYIWNAPLGKYRAYSSTQETTTPSANSNKSAVPSNHQAQTVAQYTTWEASVGFTVSSDPLENIAYWSGAIVSHNSKSYKASADITMSNNTVFEVARWAELVGNTSSTTLSGYFADATAENNANLLLNVIPTNNSVSATAPGTKRISYNMLSTVTKTLANSSTVTIPTFRLAVSELNLFEVYEAVQNDGAGSANGDVYYILVDKINPEIVDSPIDYYGTVNLWSSFGNYKRTEYYYINGITPTVDASNRITNRLDPMRVESTVSVVNLPPVEPAAFIGLQTIEEPFAVTGGNNSDPVANINAISGLKITGNTVTVSDTGHNKFFMWTPGLKPNMWKPSDGPEGPGYLPGVNGGDTVFGYGRGYYTLNDTHLPTDYPDVASYVETDKTPYSGLMPRFMYSKKFTVSPEAVAYKIEIFTDTDGNIISEEEAEILGRVPGTITLPEYVTSTNEDIGITGIRPEELFVACFWTEEHVYTNQLTSWNYSILNAAGQPTPVLSNYTGTVTRVKYIRLTELPGNAHTSRLIPDTGWAGRGWNNTIADRLPTDYNEDSILDLFRPTTVAGGSTDSDDEGVTVELGIGDQIADGEVNVGKTGQLAPGTTNAHTIPTTPLGPMLNGEFLAGLPGPCATLPELTSPANDSSSCAAELGQLEYAIIDNTNAQRRGEDIVLTKEEAADVGIDQTGSVTYTDNESFDFSAGTSAGTYADKFDTSNWQYVNVNISGNNSIRVFFDFLESSTQLEHGSVVMVQNTEPYFYATEGKAGLVDDSVINPFTGAETGVSNGGWVKNPNGANKRPTKELNWWMNARVLESTQVSGDARGTKGDQVSQYGVDFIGNTNLKRNDIVDSNLISQRQSREDWAFDASSNPGPVASESDQRVSANHINTTTGMLQFSGDTDLDSTKKSDHADNRAKWLQHDIGVSGIGFISSAVKCSLGEYVTIFIRPDSTVTRADTQTTAVLWQAIIEFTGAVVDSDLINPPTAACVEGHSTAYTQGAVKSTWQGTNSWGYFGQHKSDNERFDRNKTGQYQKKTHLDNIYYPYMRLPNPYDSSLYNSMPDAKWGEWHHCHNTDKVATGPGVRELAKRTISTIQRTTLAKYSSTELKGYFKAPYTGRYLCNGYSDDGIWAWISSEYTTTSHNGKPVRMGVDDLAGVGADTRHEYFKGDGFDKSDKYNYHRDNCLLRTGWMTTDDNNQSNKPGDRYVDMEAGKYYFVRMIAGNNKGPGYFDMTWTCTTGVSNFTITSEETQAGESTQSHSVGVKQGRFTFTGRSCAVETPATTGNADTTSGNSTWVNKYAAFATDSQARRYEALADVQNCAVGNTSNWSSCQLTLWSDIGVCPSGENCPDITANGGGIDTPGVAPGYVNWSKFQLDGEWVTLPNGERIWIPYIDLSGIGLGVGNSTTPGQQHLTGFNFLPYSAKLPVKAKVLDPQNYAFTSSELDADTVVSGQAQRVSGGLIIPFAKKLTTVSRTPYVLKSSEASDEPWGKNLENSNDLNKTTKYVKYAPRKIGSTVSLGGTTVNNITSTEAGNQWKNDSANDTTEYTGPSFDEPGTNTSTDETAGGNPTGSDVETYLKTQRQELALADVDNIIYNSMPIINITPRAIDNNGNYYNGGPTAQAYLRKPTPETDIDLNDLIGIADGTELLINGRRIVKRGSTGIDIKTQVNCANMGITAEIDDATNTLALISCTSLPFTIANGCGGGTFKQVGDFHINRGFDQSTTVSETFVAPFISPTKELTKGGEGNASVSVGGGGGGSVAGPITVNDYRRLADGSLEKFYRRPGSNNADVYETPARIPLETTNRSTGGSNYMVGDRLRLIGGTPETNVLAPLSDEVCIVSAGSGYTNPANLTVIFNESISTPGVGGAATVTKLDENGGIAEVIVINQGAGYDIDNPPALTIKDTSPIPTVVEIDAAWTSNVTLTAGTVASINEIIQITDGNGKLTGDTEISSRYVRAIGEVQLGESKTWNVTSGDVSYKDPAITSTMPRVEIALAPGNTSHIRAESYVQLSYFPGTTLNDYYITVNGAVSSSTTFVLDSLNDVNGNQYVKAGQVMSWNNGGTMTIFGYVTAVNVATKTVTLDTAVTLTDEMTVYFVSPQKKLYWIPKTVEGKASVYDNKFVIEDASFLSSGIVTNLFGAGAKITVTGRKAWYADLTANGKLVDTINPTTPKNDAKLTIAVGQNVTLDANGNPKEDKRGNGPLRVAKFIVTDVNTTGAITAIRIIDRGLYKEFPTDLTMGIPLEYDYALQGALRRNTSLETLAEQVEQVTYDASRTLGYGDPTQPNLTLYGPDHPEYQYAPFSSTKELALRNSENLSVNDKLILDRLVAKQNTVQGLTDLEIAQLNALIIELTNTLGYDKGFKHPDWEKYPEFVWDGAHFQPYSGTPGAYDPTTYVCVDLRSASKAAYLESPQLWAKEQFNLGKLILKTKVIERDPKKYNYGYYNPDEQAGGEGARVFLTAQEIPNCTERGNAKDLLGLPDTVSETFAPRSLSRALNNALNGAGYLPSEARSEYTPFGDSGEVTFVSDTFPGWNIDSPTPGTLEKLGIPIGDYNNGMLCITAILEADSGATEYTDEQAIADIQELYDTNDELGLLTTQQLQERYPEAADGMFTNTAILTLICAEKIAPISPPSRLDAYGTGKLGMFNKLMPNGVDPYGLNDNNSIFGDGSSSRMSELFAYDISDIFGNEVTLNGTAKQSAPVNYFASKRFNKRNVIADLEPTISNTSPTTTLMEEPKAWVDNYSNLKQAIIDNASGVTNYTNTVYTMADFVEGGWAYLENGIPTRWQTPLVDVEFINNALVYDPDTGNKINDLDFWDPFKGILPGFISNEISFISEYDPVSYNNARTNFGKNNIGKVWWDTSTIRYNWYEQGTDKERNANWGSAFPGSQVTVCEWVESKAKPVNWTGDGQPRWSNRFVTERRQDAKTGEYTMYYYYWVTNRRELDDRAKRNENRQLDIRTIAKYIADPVGYGLDMISFVSDKSMLLHNISDIREEESHLQINLSRNLNPEGISHTAWKLMREGDTDSSVPDHLTDKLIDSLCGENAEASPVPDPKLSDVEKYGIAFRPRQTMFKDVKAARRVMVSVLNRILSNIRTNSVNPGWDASLPTARAYLTTTDWFDVQRTDPVTNEAIRYTDTLKPIFNVTSVSELKGITSVKDGGVVQVKSNQNDTSQLWMYNGPTKKFKLVSVVNDTVKLPTTVYTDNTNPTLSSELRLILTALKDNVFVSTVHWNELFFEMMKHAYMEQKQLSWAFKTSYLYINKEENDLITLNGFKADNFQKVLDYMNEVKPFSAKIREYKDGKSTPIDSIGQNNISDYDRPPFVDLVTGTVRILDEGVDQDVNIMSNSRQYIDYVTATADGYTTSDPIRRANTTISFDRTNYQLTERAWDVANVSLQTSIGYNIANLSVQTKQEVSANASVRAADKLFKFDAEVQAQFIAEVNTHYNDVTAARNTTIVGNGTVMAGLVTNGKLKNTLALIKDKVGGNFRGETLDATKFSSIVDQADYMSAIQTDFGFDSDLFDENTDNDDTVFTDSRDLTNYGPVTTYGIGDTKWDNSKQIVSYEGVFDSNANPVTLRKNGESYDGFDGITFQRVAYGEERPEELALLDPLESVIFTVTTSDFSRGAAGNVSVFDGLDVANATLFHSTTSLKEDNSSVVITRGGIGYKTPTVVITDALGNLPTTTAVATASVNAAGTVTAITVSTGGAGYTEIHLALTETLTETTSSAVYVNDNKLPFVSVSNVLVGQIITIAGKDVGEVASISGTTVTVNSMLKNDVASGTVVSVRGQNFNYKLTNTIVTATAGVDPDDSDNFFAVDSTNGWDAATTVGGTGSYDTALTVVQERETTKVSPSAREVTYRMHHSLFGDVDFLRISSTATTKITKAMTISSTSITVDNASFLPNPTSIIPGSIWVGPERIQYGRRNGKVLSALTRGAFGTSTGTHPIGQPVYSAEATEHFNNLNPSSNVWLDTGTRYSSPSTWDEAVDNTPGDTTDNDWTVSGAWDKIAAGNITTADVGVTITNVTSTTATLTAIGTGVANIALQEGIRVFANANVALFEVVKVSANASSVWAITASYADTLDNTLFVENGTATLRSFVYAGQDGSDDFDSATISGQSALSLADRGNADLANATSIMKFLHKL